MSFLVELREKFYAADAFDGFAPSDGFTLAYGRAMAWMAQLAYESDSAKIDRCLNAWGLRQVVPLDAPFSSALPLSNTHGMVVLTLLQGTMAGIMQWLPGAPRIREQGDWRGRLYTLLLPRPLRDHLPDRYWGAFERVR